MSTGVTANTSPPPRDPIGSKPKGVNMQETTRDPIGSKWEPDIFDLMDWAIANAPQLAAVAKYIHGSGESTQYDLLYGEWERQGKPDIEDNSQK